MGDVIVIVNNKSLRLIVAGVVSPAIPMGALASIMWKTSGSSAWFPLVFLFGYLFFAIFGIPMIALIKDGIDFGRCAALGGAISILPILMLGIFSIGSNNAALSGRALFDLIVLFSVGGIGGAVFWLIAFAGLKKDTASDDSEMLPTEEQ